MLTTPDLDVYRSLYSLKDQPVWQPIRAWLEASREAMRLNNDAQENLVRLRKNQGAILALVDLLEHQDQAEHVLRQERSKARTTER